MAKSFKATIKDRCARITTNIQKMNVYIHETGMMIIKHAHQHGDCEAALWLVKAMPASMRRTMLLAWFEKYTPIRVKLSDRGDACGFERKYKTAEDKAAWWDIEGAAAEPFYEIAEKTPEQKPLDYAALIKMMEGMVKRIEKGIEEGRVPEKDQDKAKALARAISGIKINDNVPTEEAA